MKRAKTQRTRQLQLQWEVDESEIWGSLEPARQRQVVEQVAQLWMQFVVSQEVGRSDGGVPASSSLPHSCQEKKT
jgi:hypothetical protein